MSMSDTNSRGYSLYLISCQHVLCHLCTSETPNTCSVCGETPIRKIAIDQNMPLDMRSIFEVPSLAKAFKTMNFRSEQLSSCFHYIRRDTRQYQEYNERLKNEIQAVNQRTEEDRG